MKNKITSMVACIALMVLCAIPAMFVDMYNPDGEIKSVFITDINRQKENGWYEEPVSALYTPDGRSEVFYTSEVEQRVNEGWYEEPVATVYARDGRSEVVYTYDVESKINEGWYNEPVALMTKERDEKLVLLSEVDACRKDGWLLKEYCYGLKDLGEQIKGYIDKKPGTYGIYIKNLNTDEALALNDDQYRSASIIKLFQMVGIYGEFAKGNLERDEKVEKYLELMITQSDNYASNKLVDVIGHGDLRKGIEIENQYMDSLGCYNTRHMSLIVGAGPFSVFGTNRVSPYDCGIVLEKIYKRTLFSPEYSDEMLSLLKRQTRRNKIPYELPEGTVCANKTGETDYVQSDVGIVFSPKCDYVICVLTNNAPSGIEVIQKISRMTYDYFNGDSQQVY